MIVREVGGEDNGKLGALSVRIASCRLCPRLVKHREASAADPPRRYRGEEYWARPLPGSGYTMPPPCDACTRPPARR